MTIIFFILIFGAVVIAHEFGHFLLAKANGIRVVEFSVGMGPTIASFRKGDTKYSLKLLPIGGACMFEGEDGVQTKEGEEQAGAFYKASVWARISCVLAGPIFNLILGFFIALIIVSVPNINIALPVVAEVTQDGAAEEAGFQAGDRIVSVNGEKIYLFDELTLIMKLHNGESMDVVLEREGEKIETSLTPVYSSEADTYYMGITTNSFIENKGLSMFKYAWYEVRYCVKATYKSLAMLVQGRVNRQDVAGPVGIAVNVVGAAYENTKQYGWETVLLNMLNITLLLSVNLGILNLLPIPALDGGRLFFMLIEVIRGKPIPPEKEGIVHFIGFVFFMVLMVVVFFNDLVNIFNR